MSNFVGCFLTGSAAEVTPVACIDKYNFKVCNVIEDIADSYQGMVRKKKMRLSFYYLQQWRDLFLLRDNHSLYITLKKLKPTVESIQ